MRNAYLEALYELSQRNENILALISDNGAVVYDKYRADFPERFINFGISEANMVAASAGLASCGKIPFVYTISNFLTMRAFEFIRNDVCLQNRNVKLVGTGAGFVYSTLGPTHHATEDIALMRVLPNMTVLSPASPKEAKSAAFAAAEIQGPVYIRLGTNKEPEIYQPGCNFKVGEGITMMDGNDITVVATGSILNAVVQAAEELQSEGISARIVNIHTIKPIDTEIIIKAAEETGAIITVEEHSITGGLGSSVAEVLVEKGNRAVVFERMGLDNRFCEGYGTHNELLHHNGLSVEHIKNRMRKVFSERFPIEKHIMRREESHLHWKGETGE